jgi:hypothetical protein
MASGVTSSLCRGRLDPAKGGEGGWLPLFQGEGSSRLTVECGLWFWNLRGLRPASPTLALAELPHQP